MTMFFQFHKYRNTAFTQYPRPGLYPTLKPNSDKPKLQEIKIMGYSINTERYRYTQWVEFDHRNCLPIWNNSFEEELYDHLLDRDENLNFASRTELKGIISNLRKRLHLGWKY